MRTQLTFEPPNCYIPNANNYKVTLRFLQEQLIKMSQVTATPMFAYAIEPGYDIQ